MARGKELPDDVRSFTLLFKPVAEGIIEGKLTNEEFFRMVMTLGIERMVEDVIHPPDRTNLWETVVALLRRDPQGFAEFMIEAMKNGAQDENGPRDIAERWQQYIG